MGFWNRGSSLYIRSFGDVYDTVLYQPAFDRGAGYGMEHGFPLLDKYRTSKNMTLYEREDMEITGLIPFRYYAGPTFSS